MYEREFLEKYEITSGEYNDLKNSYKLFKRGLDYFYDLSMSSLRKWEKEQKEYKDYLSQKQNNERQHKQKGLLKRAFGSPKYVSPVFARDSEKAIEQIKQLIEKEKDFEFVCQTHKLNPKQVLQDLFSSESSDTIIERYRAFTYAKDMAMVKWS